MAFGTKDQMADLTWVRAIQDFDYCESEVAKQTCISSGWLYLMLDLITDLSPKFRMPYAAGGLALTVLVNDFQGASKIFDKGVREFPADVAILSRAAYHALYEEKNKEKAAGLLQRAAKAGAPPWFNMLATRLYNEEGRDDLARLLIRDLESQPNPDPKLLQTLRKKMERPDVDRR